MQTGVQEESLTCQKSKCYDGISVVRDIMFVRFEIGINQIELDCYTDLIQRGVACSLVQRIVIDVQKLDHLDRHVRSVLTSLLAKKINVIKIAIIGRSSTHEKILSIIVPKQRRDRVRFFRSIESAVGWVEEGC